MGKKDKCCDRYKKKDKYCSGCPIVDTCEDAPRPGAAAEPKGKAEKKAKKDKKKDKKKDGKKDKKKDGRTEEKREKKDKKDKKDKKKGKALEGGK